MAFGICIGARVPSLAAVPAGSGGPGLPDGCSARSGGGERSGRALGERWTRAARTKLGACSAMVERGPSSLIDSLKPRRPAPRDRPISGSRLAPNTSSSRIRTNARWIGLSSPSMVGFPICRISLTPVPSGPGAGRITFFRAAIRRRCSGGGGRAGRAARHVAPRRAAHWTDYCLISGPAFAST